METKISENQILIKVCCVIASFVLWLYIFNVENPVRQRKIVVPVKIVNKDVLAQSNFVKIDDKNSSVALEIKGNASDVFSVKADDFKIECDLKSYVMKKGDNNIPVKVVKSPSDVSIVNNQNLWISIKLDRLVKRTLPIKLLINGETKNGLFVSNPVMQIKQAEVSGASNYVYDVDRITARYDIKNISKDTTVNVVLQAEDSNGNVIKNVNISPKTVKVNIPVKNTKNVPISIKTTGKPLGQTNIESILASPDKVDISGDADVISDINGLDTEPIDLSNISSNRTINAKLIIPDKVKLVNSNGYVSVNISINDSKNTSNDKTVNQQNSEKTFNPQIKINNLSEDYTADIENNNATIVVYGNNQIINNLTKDDINCFVDLKSIAEGQKDVELNVNLPKGVTLVSKTPQTVKVTVRKKVSEDENVSQNK
ncbi:CdaR family protein [Clostridium tyrobutyricum]|jgi:YbbR domain-containing protein|uniref:CdaR family protein n=1 Tax=Clostridium tyrobutyricum TaxID=1519 RepID=UPI0018A88943|nr:CdaR family protein [Clostridium tyrobutyricum]